MTNKRTVRTLGTLLARPFISVRTYKRLLYLILAFPLGVGYGMFIGFGIVFGVGLSVVLIGLGILFVVLVCIRVITGFERWLANRLLDVDLDGPPGDPPNGIRPTLEHFVGSAATWGGLGFLSLKFWLGLVGLMLLIGYANALSLLRAVLGRPHTVDFGEVNGEPVTWTIETVPETAVAIIIGATLLVVLGNLAALFGYVSERMATSLLEVKGHAPDQRD